MAMNLEELHQLLLERNTLETFPYLAIHEANATLLNQVDALQLKCEALERQNAALGSGVVGGSSNSSTGNGDSAALRNETRLREKVEKLQEELNVKLKGHQQATMQALDTANALAQMKESNVVLEQKLKILAQEVVKKDKAITHLTQQLEDTKSTTRLAEQQYMGLKETIRSLQKENDVIKDENRKLIDRLVNDKEKTSDEMNTLNEMVDHLKKEVEMLRTLKVQDDKRRSWFGTPGKTSDDEEQVSSKGREDAQAGAKFGTTGTVIPSSIQAIVTAHNGEASCVRYDSSGADLVATCGTDSCVKVWDTSNGTLKATLRGTLVIGACDIGDDLAVGGGSDKMCRVWSLKTQRMVSHRILVVHTEILVSRHKDITNAVLVSQIHQLVGHSNKITCVRLFGGGKGVLTGSADRSMKIWDISRNTYRQTTTLRHSSTCQTIDVASDSFTTVSGHMDGGLRLWDVRTGDRTADMESVHEGGITFVQFDPSNATQVLTNGKDNCLKLIDMRTGTTISTFRDSDFNSPYSWSACAMSPNGMYVASVSGISGQLFVWRTSDAKLMAKLDGHKAGAGGIAWGRCGGQQVATVDRSGKLILWA